MRSAHQRSSLHAHFAGILALILFSYLLGAASTAADPNTVATEPILTPQAFLPLIANGYPPCPSPLPTAVLPPLYVDGPYLKRCDTGAAVWLKGVNIVEFIDNQDSKLDHLLVDGLGKVVNEGWGINLLRIPIDDETVMSLIPELDKTIDYAERYGMYCVLVPFPSAVNPARNEANQTVPDERVATIMGQLAGIYKDRNNVLYGLWNEPHPEDDPAIGWDYERGWQAWMQAGIRVAQAIRAADPISVLVIPGGRKWSREFTFYQDHSFPFGNAVYDVHDYFGPSPYYTRDLDLDGWPISCLDWGVRRRS